MTETRHENQCQYIYYMAKLTLKNNPISTLESEKDYRPATWASFGYSLVSYMDVCHTLMETIPFFWNLNVEME